MTSWKAACAGVVLAGSCVTSALADEHPVVVELYTSQGCSSCPPADALFNELAARDDVIALALHVDYWDYIGWPDSFAKGQFSERQRRYARAAGERMVYTPQLVVAGQEHMVGTKAMDLATRIEAHRQEPEHVDLEVSRAADGAISIRGAALDGFEGPVTVQVVRYLPEATVDIERGENAGRTITYSNIVTDWRRVAEWDGASPLALDLPSEGPDQPAVVILQKGDQGPIVAAARLR